MDTTDKDEPDIVDAVVDLEDGVGDAAGDDEDPMVIVVVLVADVVVVVEEKKRSSLLGMGNEWGQNGKAVSIPYSSKWTMFIGDRRQLRQKHKTRVRVCLLPSRLGQMMESISSSS